MKPNRGLKLNVDAAFLHGSASGVAILRYQRGELVCACAFPIVASSSLEAELIAAMRSTRWAIDEGYRGFQVEIDAEIALSLLSGGFNMARSDEIIEFRQICFRKGIYFRHIFREGNRAAHYLAAYHPARFTSWTSARSSSY
ncbi:unnamed protein product [Cuscuta epithymum]|uniref:RNase H type-1 domain-containing protein n=1 Tax=Cuscuta epithymum TaxID=186058 RepID=A0AAV0C5U2_9ASTE|nr:unnamed protein product [Cuscuta epithymum]